MKSSQELAEAILEFSFNPELAAQVGQNALAVVEANRGAVERHITHIRRLIYNSNVLELDRKKNIGCKRDINS